MAAAGAPEARETGFSRAIPYDQLKDADFQTRFLLIKNVGVEHAVELYARVKDWEREIRVFNSEGKRVLWRDPQNRWNVAWTYLLPLLPNLHLKPPRYSGRPHTLEGVYRFPFRSFLAPDCFVEWSAHGIDLVLPIRLGYARLLQAAERVLEPLRRTPVPVTLSCIRFIHARELDVNALRPVYERLVRPFEAVEFCVDEETVFVSQNRGRLDESEEWEYAWYRDSESRYDSPEFSKEQREELDRRQVRVREMGMPRDRILPLLSLMGVHGPPCQYESADFLPEVIQRFGVDVYVQKTETDCTQALQRLRTTEPLREVGFRDGAVWRRRATAPNGYFLRRQFNLDADRAVEELRAHVEALDEPKKRLPELDTLELQIRIEGDHDYESDTLLLAATLPSSEAKSRQAYVELHDAYHRMDFLRLLVQHPHFFLTQKVHQYTYIHVEFVDWFWQNMTSAREIMDIVTLFQGTPFHLVWSQQDMADVRWPELVEDVNHLTAMVMLMKANGDKTKSNGGKIDRDVLRKLRPMLLADPPDEYEGNEEGNDEGNDEEEEDEEGNNDEEEEG